MKTTLEQTTCADCGQPFPVQPAGSCTTGYATLPKTEQRICYPCADKREIEELRDRSKPFCAYVGNGTITSWTGGRLMTITRATPCALTRQSWTHDRRHFKSIHAVDVHGGHWAGRGSVGVVIKLRPVKSI